MEVQEKTLRESTVLSWESIQLYRVTPHIGLFSPWQFCICVFQQEVFRGVSLCCSKRFSEEKLLDMFPEGSGNTSLENFEPAWFLLENHHCTGWVRNMIFLPYFMCDTRPFQKLIVLHVSFFFLIQRWFCPSVSYFLMVLTVFHMFFIIWL